MLRPYKTFVVILCIQCNMYCHPEPVEGSPFVLSRDPSTGSG